MSRSVSVRTVYLSTISWALAMNCDGSVRYVSVDRFCLPQTCQPTIIANMTRHQRSASAIQVASTRSIGCRYQSRSLGGSIALMVSPPGLSGHRYREDVPDAPADVHDHRDEHAQQEQQERVVHQLLEQRDGGGLVVVRGLVAHGLLLPASM